MTPITLIVIDIDSTLCEARPVDTFEAWEASVRASHPPVLPQAQHEIPRILAAHPNAARAVLTARHERLRDVTTAFLAGAFPGLLGTLSMQTTAEYDAWKASGESVEAGFSWSRRSKIDRLTALRRMHPGLMLLVDDDAEMAAVCGPGDVFVRAWDHVANARRALDVAMATWRAMPIDTPDHVLDAARDQVGEARAALQQAQRKAKGEPVAIGG